MELKINLIKNETQQVENQDNDNNEIRIEFAKEKFIISRTSTEWNTSGINKFLIKVATTVPDGEYLNVVCDENELNHTYKYICDLFKDFVNEYNSCLNNDQENIVY